MKKTKLCFVAGTRPEIIKVAPIIKRFQEVSEKFDVTFLTTGQHKEMAEQAMRIFKLEPDFNLDIMSDNQTLNSISAKIFEKLPPYFLREKPDMVFVQGDTTTATISGITAFHLQIPVAHIEAGLRTYNLNAPFPEELNRRLISNFSTFNFAPTELAKNALVKENIDPKRIFVTGNSVVDALEYIQKSNNLDEIYKAKYNFTNPYVLITAHRRENFGDGFENICNAISLSAKKYPEIDFIYPVHLNPNVRSVVNLYLSSIHNVKLLAPVDYIDLLALIKQCIFCITDSGGIQEEAPSFGKYTIVLRDHTERMESVYYGVSELVGANKDRICKAIDTRMQANREEHAAKYCNPFGNGKTSEAIVKIISDYFKP